MSDEKIMEMVSEIVKECDYDIWGEIFTENCEVPEEAEETRDRLLRIVKEYIH